MSLKNHIEALLFLTDKPIKAAVIARTLNQDVQEVRQAMLELINDYETRNSALEIADEDGYMLQVKDEFSNLVDEFAPFELPTSLVRTLSAIAIKQPVMQSEVIKLRGAGAYDHIKELIARELIHKKEDGRSPMLTTTKKFQHALHGQFAGVIKSLGEIDHFDILADGFEELTECLVSDVVDTIAHHHSHWPVARF